MNVNPLATKGFGEWENISNFSLNGDEWTAPSDGFVNITVADVSTTLEYVYLQELPLSAAICTLVMLNGAGGATWSTNAPVKKGKTYRLSTNISTALLRFRALI